MFTLSTHAFVVSPLCNHRNGLLSQYFSTCKQLTKTLGFKRPAVDWLIVVYCSSVNFPTKETLFVKPVVSSQSLPFRWLQTWLWVMYVWLRGMNSQWLLRWYFCIIQYIGLTFELSHSIAIHTNDMCFNYGHWWWCIFSYYELSVHKSLHTIVVEW